MATRGPSILSQNPGLFVRRPDAAERLARDLQGRYAKLQTQAQVAHERMARDAAKYIQNELRARIAETGRQQNVGRGRNSHLIRALGNSKNRVATKDGFSVVLENFMNSSRAAPYWRNLEYGSNVHVGREMRGYFLSRSGKVFPPLTNRRHDGRLIQMGATFSNMTSTIGVGRSGRGRNTQTKINGHTYGQRGGGVVNDGPGFVVIIRKPIPAYEYAAQGSLRWIAEGGSFANYYEQALKDVPYNPVPKKPKVSRSKS